MKMYELRFCVYEKCIISPFGKFRLANFSGVLYRVRILTPPAYYDG